MSRAACLLLAAALALPACTPASQSALQPAPPAAPPAQRFTCMDGQAFTLQPGATTSATLVTASESIALEGQPVASGFAYAGSGHSLRGKGMALDWTRPDGGVSACTALPPITDTDWVLVAFVSSDDAIGTKIPPNPENYVLRFAADGTLSARLDCNRLTGSWQAMDRSETGGSLALTGGGMTRAMCQPGAMDSQIASQLGYVRTYTLKDDRLYLALMADGGIYEFRRAAP